MNTSGRSRAALAHWISPGVIALTFVVMLFWTWAAWPDAIVDFGRELYVPWRLAAGEVLYRDIASFYGPLSPYVNSILFKIFGASLTTLTTFNIIIIALFTYWLFQILQAIGSRLGATVGCVLFITLFAFGHLVRAGNYNFVCPYSHEAMHGLVLSIAGLFCLMRYEQRGSAWYVPVAGLALGLVFLTKIEPFIAAAGALTAGVLVSLWMKPRPGARKLMLLAIFLISVLLPPLVAFGLLCTAMPPDQALRGTLGSWLYVFNEQLRALPFFREGMGTNDVRATVFSLAVVLGWYALVFVPAALLAVILKGQRRYRAVIVVAVFIVAAIGVRLVMQPIVVRDFARPIPVLLLVAGLMMALKPFQQPGAAPVNGLRITPLVMIIFALLMLLKMILNVRIFHYGFVLAMPATVMLAVVMVDWIPNWLSARGAAGSIFRAVALACLVQLTITELVIANHWISEKTILMAHDGDVMLADAERGEPLDAAVKSLRTMARPGETLAVLPEGVMLNYLSRIPSSVPYLTFLPPDMAMFGEKRMLQALQSHPPTYIALTPRETPEYGVRRFGRDYAQPVLDWIRSHYHLVDQTGATDWEQGGFGIIIMRYDGGN